MGEPNVVDVVNNLFKTIMKLVGEHTKLVGGSPEECYSYTQKGYSGRVSEAIKSC